MINLIGDIPNQSLLNSDPQSVVHLYGKEPRPGRKIGHITWVLPSYEQAQVVLKSNPLALAALSQN
jgi:5-(carboxyamino)imidazole ribonucleotide synthase